MESLQTSSQGEILNEERVSYQSRPLAKTQKAAMESGLSMSFLYHNWKRIPAARRAGNALRWDVDQLLEWMREQAQAG